MMMWFRPSSSRPLGLATALLVVAAASTATTATIQPDQMVLTAGGEGNDHGGTAIPASSSLGNKLLSKAKPTKRQLNGDDDGYDYTWIADYSLVFHSCHTTIQFEGGRGGEDGGDGSPYRAERMVEFKLCPTSSSSSSCSSSCSGGAEYIVELQEFVESYLESKMEAMEYNCEQTKENCYCEDDANDDEACEKQCYINANQYYCIENDDDGDDEDEFEVDRYLECREMEVEEQNNDNDGNYYNDDKYEQYYLNQYQIVNGYVQYWIGPYCGDSGKSIYLSVYEDEGCTKRAASGTYEAYNFGKNLPYSSESIVDPNECISCKEPQNNQDQNDGDQQDEDAVLEICEELYERAGKCEEDLSIDYPNVGSCDYIHSILPKLERIFSSSTNGGGGGGAGKGWAIFFGLTTFGFAGLSFYMYQQLKRRDVDLSSTGGAFS